MVSIDHLCTIELDHVFFSFDICGELGGEFGREVGGVSHHIKLLGGGLSVLDGLSVLLEVGGVKLWLDIVAVVIIGRDDVMIVDGIAMVVVMIGRDDDVMIVDGVFEGDVAVVKLLAVLSLSSVDNPSLWTCETCSK